MKKLFLTLTIVGSTLLFACNSGDTAKREKKEAEIASARGEETNEEKAKDKAVVINEAETKATAEMCSCINSSLTKMSPKVQQIFIRAGNSDRPLQVLQDEIVTISDKEQTELFEQLQRFSTDPKLQNCSEDIRKKYGLDENDKAAQEKILNAAQRNKDCELVYALIKIGMQQQPGAGAGN